MYSDDLKEKIMGRIGSHFQSYTASRATNFKRVNKTRNPNETEYK